MKHPTYKEAIEGVDSPDPKERVIGLLSIAKGLKWRSKAKMQGLNWKGKAIKYRNVEKLIAEFRKQESDAKLNLEYVPGVKGLIAECDYKKYYQRVNEWKRHLKENKKRLNEEQKAEKEKGIENVRKAFKAIKSILKEIGATPNNWKETFEGKGVGHVEFELSEKSISRNSRIKSESRRATRISKLQSRITRYVEKSKEQ